jgi:hypothetical protein
MDLSGNVLELSVPVGNTTSRAFAGMHGDGVLTTTASYEGNATNTDWPGINATPARGVTGAAGAGIRGGSYSSVGSREYLSSRIYATCEEDARYYTFGIRGARTAP